MKFKWLLLLLLLSNGPSFSQASRLPCNPDGQHESLPVFPGGDEGFFKLIADNLAYPEAAQQERVGGRVVLGYTVDTTGQVTDIRVVEGVREDIDREAVRLLSSLPAYTPAFQNCRKVSVRYRVPIYFYPDRRWKRKFKKGKISSGASSG